MAALLIAAAALLLIPHCRACAEDTIELWNGAVKKGDIPTRTTSSYREVAIDEVLMSLGLLPNRDLTSISSTMSGRKIEFWNASNVVRSAGKIVSLPIPVSSGDGHWWGEAGGVKDAVEYFFASTGKEANFRWGATPAREPAAQPTQNQSAPDDSRSGRPPLVEIPKAEPSSPETAQAQREAAERRSAKSDGSEPAPQELIPRSAEAPKAEEQPSAEPPAPPEEKPAPPQPAAPAEASSFTGNKRPIVVVDAGHGGHDPGAMANNVREKDINLKAALQLKGILASYGVDVRLTRATDVFLKLAERTAFANKNDADVFVSLHCNAMPKGRGGVAGLEYYIMALPSDRDAMNLAIAENREVSAGVDSVAAAKNADKRTQLLLKILGDMQQNDKINESTALSEMLHRSSKAEGLPMRKVAQAPFFVLRGAGMPAVLVEMGYLTNAPEAARLSSASYRDKLCRAIAQGVVQYIREHPTQR